VTSRFETLNKDYQDIDDASRLPNSDRMLMSSPCSARNGTVFMIAFVWTSYFYSYQSMYGRRSDDRQVALFCDQPRNSGVNEDVRHNYVVA